MAPQLLTLHKTPVPKATATCRAAQPDDLKHWPFVRSGLVSIKKRQEREGHRPTWTPEHVRDYLIRGEAELWLGFDDDEVLSIPSAFTITQYLKDPFLNITTKMFVWMSYKAPYSQTNVVEVINGHIAQVARERGLRGLQALTVRPGLARRLRRLGWRTTMFVIEKDLFPQED